MDGDRIDELTGAHITMELAHHEIHEGDHFFVREATALGNGASRVYLIVTPNTTTQMHMAIKAENSVETTYTLKEGVSVSANGTAITAVNRNRNSANAATLGIYHTPTSPTGGATLATEILGSGRTFGGMTRDENEMLLKYNTKYTLTILNNTTGTDNVTVTFDWYEHE